MSELTGCRQLGSETEEKDIWHHQCTRRSGVDREEKQEHNPVEVWTFLSNIHIWETVKCCFFFWTFKWYGCFSKNKQNITNIWFVYSTCTFLSVIFRVSRGENSGSQTQEVVEQVKALKAQISELEAQEKELDNQKSWLEENIKHLNHDPITSAYPLMAVWPFSFFLWTVAVNLTIPAALNNLNKSSTQC